MLAAGDVDAARRAADELVELAAVNAAPVVGACSADHVHGAVLLGEGDAKSAIDGAACVVRWVASVAGTV